MYQLDEDDVIEDVCNGCHLVRETHSGWIDGEWINPPEYNCPLDGCPRIALDAKNWSIYCELRESE